ncbi:amidohydrolase family protein, partial [Helicobacter sp. faydin-H76]
KGNTMITRRKAIATMGAVGVGLASAASADEKKSSSILIKNATVFDGYDQLPGSQDVLIKDNKISKVGPNLKADEKTKIIDAKGKFLMPGLSDAHWHTVFAAATFDDFNMPDQGLVLANAIQETKRTVLRGFTTVRDVAGGVFGIKKAIDEKIITGPRIFPSGAFVSQTSGHGDMREITDPPSRYGGVQSVMEKAGDFVLADGVDEVLTAVRWQLKKGASQIKIGAGGGVISHFDPMDSLQFTLPEIKAATSAARDWGTYVCSHVYSDAGVNRAIDGGVKSIEHGQQT